VIASPRRLLGLAGCLHGALRELKRSARTGDHRQARRADAHTRPGSDVGPAPPGRQRRTGQPDRRRQVGVGCLRQAHWPV